MEVNQRECNRPPPLQKRKEKKNKQQLQLKALLAHATQLFIGRSSAKRALVVDKLGIYRILDYEHRQRAFSITVDL
jgi:hypothetical protein